MPRTLICKLLLLFTATVSIFGQCTPVIGGRGCVPTANMVKKDRSGNVVVGSTSVSPTDGIITPAIRMPAGVPSVWDLFMGSPPAAPDDPLVLRWWADSTDKVTKSIAFDGTIRTAAIEPKDCSVVGAVTVISSSGSVTCGVVTAAPVTYYTPDARRAGSAPSLGSANRIRTWAASLPALSLTTLDVEVITADTGNVCSGSPSWNNCYDVCVYNAVGTLAAHSGPVSFDSTGAKSFAVVGGPKSLPQGLYYIGWGGTNTSGGNPAGALGYAAASNTYNPSANAITANGMNQGACLASITPPSLAANFNTSMISMGFR